MKIEEYIPNGAGAAITAADLAKTLNMEVRELQKHVQAARCAGVPICASNSEPYGLFVAETPEELEQYINSLNRRIKNMTFTSLALRDKLAEMTGQQTIEGA